MSIYQGTSRNHISRNVPQPYIKERPATRYYGVTTGIDGKEVNPRNLNAWLKNQPDGYYDGAINFRALKRFSGNRLHYLGRIDARNDELMAGELCNGRPVILNVPNHFVVATGEMCVNAERTWSIKDPGKNISTLEGYGNTYLGLRIFKSR